jgi:hypothetical protein
MILQVFQEGDSGRLEGRWDYLVSRELDVEVARIVAITCCELEDHLLELDR